jgi:mannose-6-phosphate isomerase-like protein (cupin superfamily)
METIMTAQAKHFRPGDGKTYQLGRITPTFKTSAADTGGAYTLCETIEPPDAAAGLHRHPTYDETHIICEGHYECQLGDAKLKLGPGEMMFAPRGTPHSVKSVDPEIGREWIISSPGGIFDAFIAEASGALAAAAKGGPSADFRVIAAKYGIEFLS